MSLLDVKSALIEQIESLAFLSTLPKSYPNRSLETPNGTWLNVTFNPSSVTPTSAFKGQDHHEGFLQVDFNAPIESGDGDLLNLATQLQEYFTAGKSFVYNSQKVVIRYTEISPGRVFENFYRISASVMWYARTTRNA